MYCKECGRQFPNDNANFCLDCGVKKSNGNNFCQICGEARKGPNQDVCLSCGSKLKSTFGGFDNPNVNYKDGVSDKTKLITLILWFFVGAFGEHQFYVGNNKRGFLFVGLFVFGVITCGFGMIASSIFMIIDLVKLLTDKMIDGEGRIIAEWQ